MATTVVHPREQVCVAAVIGFLRIEREGSDAWTVRVSEVFDDGQEDFIDIYAFGYPDPDVPFVVVRSFQSVEAALAYAVQDLSASLDRFVNAGVIQDEYKDRYHPDW